MAILPYLARLRVSHVYASPILMARPGSTHGYDAVDVEKINPELGGREGFIRFSDALKANGLGLIVDIVPNHMGIGGSKNPWWQSVLEWGKASPHARSFDIDWERPGAQGKLVVPLLGGPYGDVLEKGELTLAFDAPSGRFAIRYGEHVLPLSPLTYPMILGGGVALVAEGEDAAAVLPPGRTESASELIARGEAAKRALAEMVTVSPDIAAKVDQAVAALNGNAVEPSSFDGLDRLIAAQPWRTAYWRIATSDINYRRFFDINMLAGVRIEDPEVFDATHAVILGMVREGRIQGLRVDHVDGLADPGAYLAELRVKVGPDIYVLVEKILEPGEAPRAWPIAGTTGYDILNLIDGVLVDRAGKEGLASVYAAANGGTASYEEELWAAKRMIVEKSFAGELESLVGDLKLIADADRHTRDMTKNAIRSALAEIIVACPVYRSYVDAAPVGAEDRDLLARSTVKAKEASELADTAVHDFVLAVLMSDAMTAPAISAEGRAAARFRRRFQQLTGPVMAKSLEDTLFYRHVPLIALNEVGGDPGGFGIADHAFHTAMAERASTWPDAMTATATHDTKRGEDARARLLVLAEDTVGWAQVVERFEEIAAPLLVPVGGRPAPDAVDRLLLLQSLLGAWPLDLMGEGGHSAEAIGSLRARMLEFAAKALREAKRHTSWLKPVAAYEEAVAAFLEGLLSPASPFLSDMRPFAARLAYLGMLNSLSRTALKFTLPGVPDIYQGTELWDFSLVDPDNRRPVDYAARDAVLGSDDGIATLVTRWRDGAIKQRLVRALLTDRSASPDLYARGDYTPLAADGARRRNVVAFARTHGAHRLATIVARYPGALTGGDGAPIGEGAWHDTAVAVPAGNWRDILTGRAFRADGSPLMLAALFAELPVAVLRDA